MRALWPIFFLSVLPLHAGCAHSLPRGTEWVHGFTIEGNHNLSSGKLRDGLVTQKTGWWPFAAHQPFDRAAFESDLARIQAFYADHGFFGARVVRHKVVRRNDGGVDVTVVVDEGPQTHIGAVHVENVPPEQAKRIDKLTARLKLKEGAPFDYERFAEAKTALVSRLKRGGYAYAKVEGDVYVNRDRRKAAIGFVLNPGPLVHFGEPHVVGNGSIPAHAIVNRLLFSPGDKFDPGDMGASQGRIYDLGVFQTVRVELPPQPVDRADVTVEVTPGKLHELRLGAGVGAERQREEVRASAQWTLHNFLGGLRTLRLRVKPAYVVIPDVFSPQRQGVAAENDIQLTQPDIFGSSITAHALAGYDLGIHEGYQYHGPRTQLGVERPFWRDRILVGASWNLQYLNFFNIDTAAFNPATTPLGFGFTNPYRLAYLEELGQLDLRDQPLDPHYGGYLMLRVEEGAAALGGDFPYLKVTPDVRVYLPLSRRVVLAARGLFGWLEPSNLLESPITRRYALGGPSSHRGFSYGRLAPQAFDPETMRYIPIGGDAEVLLSFESRMDLVKIKGAWLGIVPFVDAGDVTPEVGQIDMGALHVATGMSLEYQTPIGVARAGLGVRLNRLGLMGPHGLPNPDPEERLAFHLTIGEAF